jgi:cyclophilin family peptidyl-prolyl cis-trans isomerase/protein-disulfide isomerase
MKNALPLVLLAAMLLISACGGAAATAPAGIKVPGSTAVAVAPYGTTQPAASRTPTRVLSATPAISPTLAPTLPPTPTVTPLPNGCQPTGAMLPPPDPNFPAVSAADYTLGPADARVTFIEYADFQCPTCAQLDLLLKKLLAAYPKDVRLIFRLFPRSGSDKALVAAQVAMAAGLQDKFWQMHDLLYTTQSDWATLTPNDFLTWVTAKSTTLGLDSKKLAADAVAADVVNHVQDAQTAAMTLGIPDAPFMLANGLSLGSSLTEPGLTFVINLIQKLDALEPKRVKECPPVTVDKAKQYFATLKTTQGDVVLQLYPDKAPLAVNSFVFLAQKGWYDGVPFHRVIAAFVAQTGDPSGTGRGNPGYFFVNEIDPALKFDRAGVVAMANSGPNSNGSQFFITYSPQPQLNGSYTIFGMVTQGLDVIQKLTPIDPSSATGAALPQPDQIIKVTIEVK